MHNWGHEMNAVTTISRRVAYGASVAALLLSPYGCARQHIYAHVESTPEAVISAEDVEEVPIRETSGREGPAEAAGRCEHPSGDPSVPGSRVVACSSAGASNALRHVTF